MTRALLLLAVAVLPGRAGEPLKLTRTIPLPGVEGRIDHPSVDVLRRRLFVAALGNNTLEVVDLSGSTCPAARAFSAYFRSRIPIITVI